MVINESQLMDIENTANQTTQSKEGFGNQEPIDPLELRAIPLTKIKDLDKYERDILQNSLYQEIDNGANQDLAVGDLVVNIAGGDFGYEYAEGATSLAFADQDEATYLAFRLDCGAGMVIDSITLRLRRQGIPVGTLGCEIWTGLNPSGSNWDETTGSSVETSSTTYDAEVDISTSFTNYTFNFAGNFYEGNIFFRIGTGNTNPTNYLFTIGDTTAGNHPRLQTLTVDETASPEEWNQENDMRISITGNISAGWYKAHGDFATRSINPYEVMEAVSSGGTIKLNMTDTFFKQSGLTGSTRYYVGYDGTPQTSGDYLLGISASTTSIVRLDPPKGFDVIQGTYSPASLDSIETYSHALGVPPRTVIMWAGGQALQENRLGFWDGKDHGTSIDRIYTSSHENAEVLFKDYDTSGGDYIQALVDSVSSTEIDIARSESGSYGDTDAIYFTMLLIA